MGADELSECVQDFYHNLSERLQAQFKGTAWLLRSSEDHSQSTPISHSINASESWNYYQWPSHCSAVYSAGQPQQSRGRPVTQIIVRPTPALFLGSSEHVESVMDEVEKYMMTRLYKEVFCPETTDDEKKDLAIQKRIRSANTSQKCLNLSKGKHNNSKHDYFISCCYRALHWVTIEMLCVPVEEEIPEVSDSVVKAITGESSWRLQKDTFSFKKTS